MNMTITTREEFITREVRVWGEDYIFDLLDRGYEVAELRDSRGVSKWTWLLTNERQSATVQYGRSDGGLLPFSLASRASDG